MDRIKYILIFVVICCFYLSTAAAETSFIPWNADVKIADENIEKKTPTKTRVDTTYSAPQGGAFILIRFFQIVISPQDGPNCRFHPTCSLYGKIAVFKYGALIGSFLIGDRLIRCNPYSPPGDDPVPESIFE